MVRHVRVHHHAGIARWFAFAGIVDRFVKTHGTGKTQFLHAAKVLKGCGGIHRQRQHRGIRGDYEVILQIRFQPEAGNAEGLVLVDLMRIEGAIGALREAPGDALRSAVFDLNGYRLPAGIVQQRVRVTAREQERHQVLEHGAAPGEQRLASHRGSPGPRQGEPVLHGDVPFCDGYQACKAAFAGKQIVVVGELHWPAHGVADSKQPHVRVVQEPHVDPGGDAAGRRGNGPQLLDSLPGVGLRALIIRRHLIQPFRDLRL